MIEREQGLKAGVASDRAGLPARGSLAVDPERLARMRAMSPAQRRAAAERGVFTLGELLKWAAAHPDEVPLVNGEFFFIAASLADNEDASQERLS